MLLANPKKCSCGRMYVSSEDIFQKSQRFRLCNRGHLWANCECKSTLFYKDAISQPWFSECLYRASSDAREFFSILKSPERFPRPPGSSIEKLEKVLETTEATTFIRSIKDDPRIAGKIVGAANIAASIRDNSCIKDLGHAVIYLGLKTCKDMLNVFELSQCLPSTAASDHFWEKSRATANLATSIASRIFSSNEKLGEAYIAGLLANIGKLVLLSVNEGQFQEISRLLNDAQKPMSYISAEQSVGATPHQVLSEITLCFWGIEPELIDAAGYHHREPMSDGERIELWEIVALANQLSHWAMLEPHMMNDGYFKRLLYRFKWTERMAEETLRSCQSALK